MTLQQAVEKMHEVWKSANWDDRCWLDLNEVFVAAGLEPAPLGLPRSEVFLANCVRFERCASANLPYKTEDPRDVTIMELRQQNTELLGQVRTAADQRQQAFDGWGASNENRAMLFGVIQGLRGQLEQLRELLQNVPSKVTF